MGDVRSELTMATEKAVKVVLVDGSLACLGTLLDLSLSGARIRVPLPIEAGRMIDMCFDDYQQRFRAQVMWADETEIGIAFDSDMTRSSAAEVSAWTA